MYSTKTKQIYIRKIFPHDLTHEVSVTTEIVNEFFEGKTNLNFYKGTDHSHCYDVTINSATDPRFGGDFTSLWTSDNLQLDDLIVVTKLNSNEYELTTSKKGTPLFDFLSLVLFGNQRHAIITCEDNQDNQIDLQPDNLPIQQIYYGAPGTGKSYAVEEVCKKYAHVRTTFHPDSDYSTFVGAYKPQMEEVPVYGTQGIPTGTKEKKIVYKYTPQAFMHAYIQAWKDLSKPVFLVIEEINRGNCAQIFGDLFQLLDRNDNGNSCYAIKADGDISQYLADVFAKEIDDNAPDNIKDGSELLLPPNLYIWATMNTSDQSLFPIDSAFKRRWDWKYVPIDTRKESWSIDINGTEYSWSSFLEKINDEIGDTTSSEDKKLGFYFCKAEDGVISCDRFVSKVLFYIYNDVFKDYGLDREFFKDKDNNSKAITFQSLYKMNGDVDETVVAKLLDNLAVEVLDTNSDDEVIDDEPENRNSDSGSRRILNVEFPDGSSIAIKRFPQYMEVLQKIGLDKAEIVAEEKSVDVLGCSLVSKVPEDTIENANMYTYQEYNGYFVVKGIKGKVMQQFLPLISDRFNLGLKVQYKCA